MIIERSREHTVNLGNYENVKIGAKITLDEDDFKDKTIEQAVEHVNVLLDALMEEDLKEAAANVPEGADTHLETWKK